MLKPLFYVEMHYDYSGHQIHRNAGKMVVMQLEAMIVVATKMKTDKNFINVIILIREMYYFTFLLSLSACSPGALSYASAARVELWD